MSAEKPYAHVRTALLDFDSVICGRESMDLVFECLLADCAENERRALLDKVSAITRAGMSGEIPFSEALGRRLSALPQKTIEFQVIVDRVRSCLAESFCKHARDWNWENIHIISSGFRQIIEPALSEFDIPGSHIHCNELIVSPEGVITGVDTANPLTSDNGKTKVVRSLSPAREIVMVGDGFTDLQVAQSGEADYFFAYVEFVRRENIIKQANELIIDFTHLSKLLRL